MADRGAANEDGGRRSKKHHWVPQLHLRRFASDGEQIATVDLSTQRRFMQSVRDAAAANKYNEVTLTDGSTSDRVERFLGEMEGDAARVIRDVIDQERFPPEGDDRLVLAFYLAFQYLRTPATRRFFEQLAEHTFKLEVAAGGPQALRKALESRGETVTEELVAEEWKIIRDFDWSLTLPTSQQLRQSLELAQEFAPVVASMAWHFVRFDHKKLLTCDHPVGLLPRNDKPAWSGTGFFTASLIWLPLSRAVGLMVRPLLSDDPRPPEDVSVPPTAKLANILNQLTVCSADRWLYHHPDDDPCSRLSCDTRPASCGRVVLLPTWSPGCTTQPGSGRRPAQVDPPSATLTEGVSRPEKETLGTRNACCAPALSACTPGPGGACNPIATPR